jgi:hypothetical protein
MKSRFKIIAITFLAMLFTAQTVDAKEYVGAIRKGTNNNSGATPKSAFCLPATGSSDLDINNVRTRINTGGDMWWNFETAQYEIPKGSRKHSMFAAALWIGGLDVNGQLKLAALRFRQVGNDYWTGPLTVDGNASIDQSTCKKYDKHWKITRAQVEKFIAWSNDPTIDPNYSVPKVIQEWPAHPIDGNPLQSFYLAPFMDVNGDGVYRWEDGDYPYYDFTNELCPRNEENRGKRPIPAKDSDQDYEQYGGNIVRGAYLVDQVLKGDETLWWVFNDKGGPHTETKGEPIGLEIRAQAFGFATNDEINNMTFYTYEIINRSTYTLTETYFSQWVDPDLGYAADDYVGCDVGRGLGYCYNGNEVDGNGRFDHYGAQPPAIGVDFFQGPYMDPDGYDNPGFKNSYPGGFSIDDCSIVTLDGTMQTFQGDSGSVNLLVKAEAINGVNFGDGIIDNERFGMRRFVYHNNDGSVIGDPSIAIEYYNMLRGIWKDGQKMKWGGNAHPTAGGNGPVCDFMFPYDSDPCFWGTKGQDPGGALWNEISATNAPGDRRFMQSAGPFTLKPGAVNYITVGIPWARAASGGAWASVELLRRVDDKCQTLFDNCFKVLDGPDAPEIVIQELDQELILFIKNTIGNNIGEKYKELDPNIPQGKTETLTEYIAVVDSTGHQMVDSLGHPIFSQIVTTQTTAFDRYYKFEGYQIFQLKNKNISVAEIYDPAVSRIVYQCDIKNFDKNGNAIATLVNFNYNEQLGASVPQQMVKGANQGISHSIRITEDQFAEGDKRLVNHKKYYFIAIAYAHNSFKPYSQDEFGLDGQKLPYLAGRKGTDGQSIKPITGIPHKTDVEANGTVLNASYGDQPMITRLEGHGNGGLVLDLTKASVDKIMSASPWKVDRAEYIANAGPISVKVVDPLNVKGDNYMLYFTNPSNRTEVDTTFRWMVVSSQDTIYSEETIQIRNEQLLLDIGLSISIEQFQFKYLYPDLVADSENAKRIVRAEFLTSSITFADSTRRWLTGVPDIDGASSYNWIRSGSVNFGDTPTAQERELEDYYLKVGRDRLYFDAEEQFEKVINRTWAPFALAARWTNSPGYADEAGYSRTLNNLYSVDVVITPDKSKWTRAMVLESSDDKVLSEGGAEKLDPRKSPSVNKDGNPDNSGTMGMGWFPGYAINVETGERLNIMFAEDSWLVGENGRDMKFNPTSNWSTSLGNILWGGKHYIYILGASNRTAGAYNPLTDCPAYDESQWLYEKFQDALGAAANMKKIIKTRIFSNIMWTSIPMAVPGEQWLSNEVKFRIRVSRPYMRYLASHGKTPELGAVNNDFPVYMFNTHAFATQKGVLDTAESALDLINVVPNPYYGFSFYEENQIDTRVKITNLPDKCTVTIYSMNGSLIRRYTKDDSEITSLDWDLKNHAGIPIAGGVYIIHVKADGIGEKTIKWFGALRPTDLNSF